MDTIISLYLNDFKNGSPNQKKKFVQDLGRHTNKLVLLQFIIMS